MAFGSQDKTNTVRSLLSQTQGISRQDAQRYDLKMDRKTVLCTRLTAQHLQ